MAPFQKWGNKKHRQMDIMQLSGKELNPGRLDPMDIERIMPVSKTSHF